MKLSHSHKRYIAFMLSLTVIFTLFQFSNKTTASALSGEPILDLDTVNQNLAINFSALKGTDGKMTISNDAASGGFASGGITNSSYLITPSKISGDFSVEAKLSVTSRTITGTGGVVGVGAFSGTGAKDAMVAAVARGDNGSRSYYQKADGSFGAGSPDTKNTSGIGTSVVLKIQRIGGTYTAIINGETKALSGLNSASAGDMYLGFVACGAAASVESFVIKQAPGTADEKVIYDLSKPSLPRPTITASASGSDIGLSWSSVNGATGYNVEYKKTTDQSWTQKSGAVSGIKDTVTGLTAMTPYNFRVKVIGGPSDNLYSAPIVAVPGFKWSEVLSPAITGADLSTDGTEVAVNFNMTMGALGATKVDVEMSKGGTVIDTKNVTELVSVLGSNTNSVKFTPKESGTYSFKAKASRTGENAVKESAPYELVFDLPVGKPVVRTACIKTGSVKVSWDAVKEAQTYTVEYKKASEAAFSTAASSTAALSYTIDNLEVGTIYDFRVTAFKNGKSAVSDVVEAKVKEVIGEAVEWNSVIFGQSTSSSSNSVAVDNVKDTVTVTAGTKDGSVGGGKITGSHDGISYYYTEIDPSKNFELTADIKVNFFAKGTPDNQEAFGIMARDAIGKNLDSTVFPSNMAMVGGYRGLVQSVFRNNVKDSSGTGAVMEGITQFGERPANDGTATYKMTMKKTNTGYQVNVDNGKEKIYYRPKQLEVLNPGKIYVGFFAARVASITVSNVVMKTSNAATDAPGVPEPPEPIVPSINLTSRTASAVSNYDLKLLANASGNVQVKQNGAEIYNGAIAGNASFVKNTKLAAGDNNFEVMYTPGPKENVTSKDPVTSKFTVTYKYYGVPGGKIYVSPAGKPEAAGTENDPIDIYSAVNFISDGQTIYARGGTYNLSKELVIDKGNDGTGDKLKVLSAYPNERPVFDFGKVGKGFTVYADCWKIYGIDIARGTDKGLQISGNYNIVELVNSYANEVTGIQISGSSQWDKKDWPSYNLILNCTAYDNKDASENNADGFAAKLTSGEGNVFRGCISHNNADDGWDLYSKLETGAIGAVTVENCISYGNGTMTDGTKTKGDGNGFKLGGEGLAVKHVLRNSLSFNNNAAGVTSNSDPAIIVENCTSVDNGKANYEFAYYNKAVPAVTPTFIAKNNISFRTAAGPADSFTTDTNAAALASDTNYFYNGSVSQNASTMKVLASDFKSTVKPAAYSRNADGTIAIGDFMTLAPSSKIQVGAKLLDFSNITKVKEKPVVTPKPDEPKPDEPKPDEPKQPEPTKPTNPANTTDTTSSTVEVANNVEAVKKALSDSKVTKIIVSAKENSKVDKSIFEAIKGQNKEITFNAGDITWTFNGKDINTIMDLDLSLKEVSKDLKDKITAKVKAATGKDQKVFAFSFNHDGPLLGNARITLFLGKEWAGKTVSLRRYFKDKNTYESVAGQNQVKVDENGYVQFTLDHCSDYFVTEAELPKTGGMPINDYMFIGTLLIAAGTLSLRRKRA